jgi:uncharacterized protein (DUF2252 family)
MTVDVATQTEAGKMVRKAVPRTSHAGWDPASDRFDPVELLRAQEETRVPDLLAVRHERMLASPFAFYRGAAVIMAADLATVPDTGLRVQACGDAHLANFGGFAAPDRALVFDMNDFDETNPGPFEWDVKRLAVSFELAGRDRGLDGKRRRDAVKRTVRAYREAMAGFAGMSHLDLWYARLDTASILSRWQGQVSGREAARLEKNAAKAAGKNSLKAFSKLTEYVDGKYRIVSDPPLIVPLREELSPGTSMVEWLTERFHAYRATLQGDRQHLLDRYRIVDMARKVVGVGSVGTRTWIILLFGRDENDPLFLQIKEATTSVLEPYCGASEFDSNGRRVVEGQRLLQAASDILLGWVRTEGIDGVERDYYVRQLWDGKMSPAYELMPPEVFDIFAEMCGWTLARGHARSGDRIAISGYLGTSETFDDAIAEFAAAYADQNERDYDAVRAAVRDGLLASATASAPEATTPDLDAKTLAQAP